MWRIKRIIRNLLFLIGLGSLVTFIVYSFSTKGWLFMVLLMLISVWYMVKNAEEVDSNLEDF
jgi:Ca2+/Na+ antiporter